MAARAMSAFRAQTYPHKNIIILETGEFDDQTMAHIKGGILFQEQDKKESIGELRNRACLFGVLHFEPNVFVHWDDDDYSHPNRIAEQVAHLQSSGADAVGYNELLFWRERVHGDINCICAEGPRPPIVCRERRHSGRGEAWLYKSASIFPPPGTSLCYWRRIWEQKQFPDLPKPKGWAGKPMGGSEDHDWCKGLNVATQPCFRKHPTDEPFAREPIDDIESEPRMIASIHGENTMPYDIEAQIERGAHTNWKRVPEWDSYCRERMAL